MKREELGSLFFAATAQPWVTGGAKLWDAYVR